VAAGDATSRAARRWPVTTGDRLRSHDVDVERLTQLHRDEHLVVVHKPSGLLTHRGWGRDRDTALARVRDMIGARVHLPHRLDRATSGVLIAALDEETHRALAAAFAEGRVHKTYLALVRGHAPDAGRIDHPITLPDRAEALDAQTDYALLGHSPVERCSLLRVEPKTGRPHQIRRHLKHVDHPIVGDTRYGRGDVNRLYRERYGFHRLGLHALSVAFDHPRTGESLRVEAPLPGDFARVLDALGLGVALGGGLAPTARTAARSAGAEEDGRE